jgi:opacity protein-like surface antigen
MRSFKKMSLVAAALMASTAMVQAADLIPAPTHELPPEIVPVASSTGWYIRGDIGYTDTDVNGVTFQPLPNLLPQSFSRTESDSTFTLQGGIGYQVTDYFRVDATIADHGSIFFDGSSASGPTFDCAFLFPDNANLDPSCAASDTAELEATTFMANAYLDLGTVNGFTPYVGAGIGAARIKWSELNNDISCDLAAGGDCLNSGGVDYNTSADSTHNGFSDTRFAWSLHAGGSLDINCRVKADVGYTYTRIEGGDFFGYANGGSRFTPGTTDAGVSGRSGDIELHTGRVGLRYALSDAGCSQPSHQPQVVYK